MYSEVKEKLDKYKMCCAEKCARHNGKNKIHKDI